MRRKYKSYSYPKPRGTFSDGSKYYTKRQISNWRKRYDRAVAKSKRSYVGSRFSRFL